MGFFQKFPYTDDHQLNLDWILRLFKTLHGGTTGQILKKRSNKDFDWEWGSGGGGGTSDYNDLTNKPQINGNTLSGNKTTSQLGISIPQPSSSTPLPAGTGASGSSTDFSRGDHIHPAEIYQATYGTTTNAQLETAYNAGKIIVVTRGTALYFMTNRDSATLHRFSSGNKDKLYYINCQNDTWSTPQYAEIPLAALTTPADLGTAATGGSSRYAKADHVHNMPSAADVGAAPAVTEVTIDTAGSVTQALDPGKIYHFTGALTDLTVTLVTPGAGILAHYHFDFDSGSTPPTISIPVTVSLPGGSFTPAASKHYEVDILNNYGVIAQWAS